MTTVYLNGKFIPLERAQVSVMDRGFLYGDGAYDVIPIYKRHPFRVNEHLDRLEYSLEQIEIELPNYDRARWMKIICQLIDTIPDENQSVYLQVTRGASDRRHHDFPSTTEPTVFAMTEALVPMPIEQLQQGSTLVTYEDVRWARCDIKSINLLPNVLAYNHARKQNAIEALLIRDGMVIECASSNIFMVKDNALYTPPVSNRLLAGVTRQLVLELATQHNIPCHEKILPLADLLAADEVWITASKKEIAPIVKIDEHVIGDGIPGPLWKEMLDHYLNIKQLN